MFKTLFLGAALLSATAAAHADLAQLTPANQTPAFIGLGLAEGVLVDTGIDWRGHSHNERAAAKLLLGTAVGGLFELARASQTHEAVQGWNVAASFLGARLAVGFEF